jgi:hypothetical protein
MRHPSAFAADCHLTGDPSRELELGTHRAQPLKSGFSCTNAERAQVQAVLGRAVTVAELRRAVGTAVAQAQHDAMAASRALRARPRSVRTSRIFRSIFNVPPTFVPAWRPRNASWPDLGALVALRIDNGSRILGGGYMHFFCWGSAAHCPECTEPPSSYRACSSYRGRHHICLGREWWEWYRNGHRGFMASTLLHEAMHIYFRLEHHKATVGRPSVNNMYCYDTLVAILNGRTPKPGDRNKCARGRRAPDHEDDLAQSEAEAENEEDDYAIRGNRYTPQEKQYASTHKSGLILTSSVIGRLERRLTARAPSPLSVSKEWARFGAGRLGDFVADYNDFVHYFGEVLVAIGRLQDLLSAGAPEVPNLMTSRQKYALRPTTDRHEDAETKLFYPLWRNEQAKYANAESGILRGLVFDVASTARQFEEKRHEFWQAAGELKRTLAAAKRLGKNKPTYDALDLSLSDALVLVDPYASAAKGIDIVVDAVQKRKEYDEKMIKFAARVSEANDEVKDRYEKLRDVQKSYWEALLGHRQSVLDRDKARLDARCQAGVLGQQLAPPGETRLSVLAEIRMPIFVADAWHALAVIGPPARAKLGNALKGRAVVEEASRRDLSWRPKSLGRAPADPFADITQIRRAWQQANSWSSILASDDVNDWMGTHEEWEEVFTKFYV